MKKNSFITIVITTHIILIFLQVHKHTLFIKNSYHQQQCEKKIAALTEKNRHLRKNSMHSKTATALKNMLKIN